MGSALKIRWRLWKALRILQICFADADPNRPQPVELNLLNEQEKQWLDEYHQQVREALSPMVESDARPWLVEATAPIRVNR